MFFEYLKALLYGILEGVTEWLPISSTGHLILFADRLPFAFSNDPIFLSEFWEFFEVAVQMGAIFALPLLFRERIFPPKKGASPLQKAVWRRLWKQVILASIPAALVGILLDRFLEHLTGKDLQDWLYRPPVVALTLILYGVAFLFVDRRGRPFSVFSIEEISDRKALAIGAFQALSLVPGTSRSGSTILGATAIGIARKPASEFSFFLAIPALCGASCLKAIGFFGFLRESGTAFTGTAAGLLFVGCLASFLVSLVSIRFLLNFVGRHSFRAFGIYRIALGAFVLVDLFWKGGF